MIRQSGLRRLALALAVPLSLHGAGLSAQVAPPPNRGGFTTSMGIPSSVKYSLGFTAGVHRGAVNETTTYLFGSMYRDLINPAIAALGLRLDAYGGRRGTYESLGDGWDWGGRVGIASPVGRFALGADYNGPDNQVDFFVSLIHPLKRGGILVKGGALRLDYIPGRNHTTAIGFTLPVGQRFAGRTRPEKDFAELETPRLHSVPFEPGPTLVEAVDNARELSRWITRLTIPFVDQWDSDWEEGMRLFTQDMDEIRAYLASDPGDLYGGPRRPEEETRAYHREMERAFSIAASGSEIAVGGSTPLGVEAWARAREILLDLVILPYDRLLGQKKRDDSTLGFATQASAAFYEWLSTQTPVTRDRLRATSWVFQEALTTLEGVRQWEESTWKDTRFHFLPFQLVLKPEDHDTQAELNSLLERAVNEPFRPGNSVFYVENEQFQVEFARMVQEARDYSVLWIHDVRGLDGSGDPDEVAYRQVVRTYLKALIDAVRAYDDTGKIPQHLILLDQWFFQANQGRLFLDLLEDPLHHELNLPKGFEGWEEEIRGAQVELRAAVNGSALLQAQARQFPEGWIENVVKVHVNITNPADQTFWTGELLPLIGLPDMIARDHRKIAFFDIGEEDPARGRAMYTGMGIGEHYVGAGWEDRALLVRGPALLSLKYAARDLLLQQGLSEEEIPYELKPRPLAPDYQDKLLALPNARDNRGLAMEVHNQVGYAQKNVDVLKAALYTLMPAGSVIKAPDSLWNLPLWASMMLGNALRGGRSLIIAPSIAHAPSAGFPQMSRAQELLARMVVAQTIFEEYMNDTGGLLRVGLYAPEMDAGNTPAKMRALATTLDENPWLAELYGFSGRTTEALRGQAAELEAAGFNREYLIAQEVVPAKLHLKAHFYATPEAWNGLLSGPEAEAFLRTYFRGLAEQNLALSEDRLADSDIEAFTEEVIPAGMALIQARGAEMKPDEIPRAALFLAVGSHNQNYRSFIMDGEVAFLVAGWSALHGLPDFITLAGLSVWVNDLEDLEVLFPRYEGMKRKLGRWMRIVV